MDNPEKASRRLIQKSDLIWIGGILLVCVVLLVFFRQGAEAGATAAQISCGGEVVRVIPLASARDGVFILEENPNVSFQIEGHRIRFVHVACPDKLCEREGYLSRPNQTAICLPNRVTLRIIAENAEFDAVVN